MLDKSLSIDYFTPGYWILTATAILDFLSTALWTYPIEAAANGFKLNSVKLSFQLLPHASISSYIHKHNAIPSLIMIMA